MIWLPLKTQERLTENHYDKAKPRGLIIDETMPDI